MAAVAECQVVFGQTVEKGNRVSNAPHQEHETGRVSWPNRLLPGYLSTSSIWMSQREVRLQAEFDKDMF